MAFTWTQNITSPDLVHNADLAEVRTNATNMETYNAIPAGKQFTPGAGEKPFAKQYTCLEAMHINNVKSAIDYIHTYMTADAANTCKTYCSGICSYNASYHTANNPSVNKTDNSSNYTAINSGDCPN